MMKQQLEHMTKDSNFSKSSIELYETQTDYTVSQQAGTVLLPVFFRAGESKRRPCSIKIEEHRIHVADAELPR
jgi:hypothetical protein